MPAKPVRVLFKGMTRKLGVSPVAELLLLDEPGSGLDPKARSLFKMALKSAWANGRTIFLTSHALANADEVCDEMAARHRRSLRFAGTLGALKQLRDAGNLEQPHLACIGAS